MMSVDDFTFASHLPVLRTLLGSGLVHTAVEAGGGVASTPLLCEACDVVTTYEQNGEWADFLRHMPRLRAEHTLHHCADRDGYFAALENAPIADLVLVDGDLARWREVNTLRPKTHIIVAHDTEAGCYFWNRVEMPHGWLWVDVADRDDGPPWASVFTDDISVVSLLARTFPLLLAYDYRNFAGRVCPNDNARHLTAAEMRLHDRPL